MKKTITLEKIFNIKEGEKLRLISPSTEPVDKENVVEYAQELLGAGADMLHCDVMDGIAVQKQTYNEKMIFMIRRKVPKLKLDVHLMTSGGSSTVRRYVRAKPFAITIQYDYFEYEKDLINALKMISEAKIKCGISLSPNVPLSFVVPYLKYLDLILVMGVVPGAGGQPMIKSTISKLKEVKHLKDTLKKNLLISFDGGVNFKNANELFEAGADVLVSGSAVFNSFDRAYAIRSLKAEGEPIVY